MTRRFIFLSALAASGVAIACGGGPPRASVQGEAGGSAAPIAVQTAEVRATSESGGIEIPATIESRQRAILTSRLSASIVDMSVREGDAVNAGAVLARFEDRGLAASLVAAQASDQAAARDLARAEALLAKGASTRNEVENATTAAARTHAALVGAREAVSYATLRAPFTGRIVKKLANVGDIVNPGQPLLEIEGTGGLEVVASVESAVHERLKTGQRIEVRIDGVASPLVATIHTLAPSADPSTHRFTLRADIRPGEGVRAGLFARIALPSAGTGRRLLVPAGAVLRRGGLTGVYVIRDGHAWLRWIAAGDTFGDALEVRAGLEDKERVALDPSRLTDGAPVSEGRQ
ncbi:MAG: efflux RND transporter periplasmic adaptor subunit [Vicinamibacteria bacterium]